MWQDITLTTIAIVLNLALIPQIIKGFKTKKRTIARSTGLMFFIGVYGYCFIYFTLKLYLAFTTALISGTLWLILFIQSLIYEKN